MISEQFRVPGVSCQHCVNAVSKEVGAIAGVQRVVVDLDRKLVTVEHSDQVAPAAIIAAIHEAGYDEVAPAA
jgi:copper ion binding protein